MADVSVEFGAQDVGLEKTLKTIQAEMAALQGKVDSGTLSFQEISQKMREIKTAEGIFSKLGGEVSEAAKSFKELEDQTRRAEAITKSNRTAIEVYSDTVDELQKLLDAGAISQKTYASAIDKAEAALKAATPQTEEAKRANEELEASLKKAEQETKALAEEQKKAEAVTKANRSATEIYNQEVEELQKHLNDGRISMDTFERAVAKADAQLAAANPQVKDIGNQVEAAGDKTKTLSGIFDAEFQKIAGAFTVGNLAAQGFQKIVELAFGAARQVVQGFSDALDLGGRLNELSSRTGETAGKLLVLETAFKNSGLEAAQVGTAINKLQNFMQDAANGGDKQRAAMQSLGISMSDLAGKTPTEEMQIFANRIAAIEDPTQRAAMASEVFGDKLGGKLLPLLTDFSPALDDAREKVGSMEQVMDENAATFDAAGEKIDAVKGKMAAFAAGVLSEVIPAVDDLGSSMEKVDAAGLGQRVGEYLTPILVNLTDATRGAIDILGDLGDANTKAANDTGILGTAYRGVTTSLDGFNKMMADSFNKFTPFGFLMETLASRGKDLRESQDSAAEGIDNAGASATEAAGKIGEVGTASDTATGKVGALGTQADATGESIASSFSLNSEFAPQLDGVASAWAGVNEQVTGNQELLSSNLSLGESLVGKTEEQSQSLGGLNEQLSAQEKLSKTLVDTYGKHAEKAAEVAAKQAEAAAKEAERTAQAQAALQVELELAEAKGTGNKEEIEYLTKKKEWLDAWKKAIASGMGEEQAAAFANNLAAAKINADNIKPPAFTTAKEDAQAMENALGGSKSFLEAMGKIEKSKAVEEAKLDAQAARAEIVAFGQYMNVDLQNMSFADIAKKLGVRDLSLTGKEQLQAIIDFVGESKDKLAVNPIDSDAFNSTWQGIQDTITGKKTILPLEANTTTAEQQVATLANPKTVEVNADITKAEEQLAGLGGGVAVELDAEQSIENIRAQLKEGIELDIAAKSGTSGLLSEIKGLVDLIKTAVEKIEPRLPVAALTA